MSRGVILQYLGDCKYRVKQLYGVDSVKRELAELSERLITIETELPQRQLELVTAVEAVESKVRQIDLLIPDYVADPDSHREQLTELRVELVRLQGGAAEKRYALNRLKSQRLSITKRQQVLRQIPEAREVDAWCADYSEDLEGEVGLVDVNDEGGQGVVVQPGYEDGAAYSAERDGQLTPRAAQSGVQLYFNAAMLPGVQKWMPRYRTGTITDIRSDSGKVTLDSAGSSAQGLDINQEGTLIDVPIQYMDCNGAAFENGDQVLVRFTASGPLVVGFASNPQPCNLPVWIAGVTEFGSDMLHVYEMEPDFSGIRKSLNFGRAVLDVAAHSGSVCALYSTDSGGDTGVIFEAGPELTAAKPSDKYYGLTSHPGGILAQRATFGEAGNVYVENYDGSGSFMSQIVLGAMSGDSADNNTSGAFASNGEIISSEDNNFSGLPGQQGYTQKLFSFDSGTEIFSQGLSAFNPMAAINDRFVIVVGGGPADGWVCSVYDVKTIDLVQTFAVPNLEYRRATASRTRFYTFSLDTSGSFDGPHQWDCRVQIYAVTGEGLTFEKEVDLNAEFGFYSVFGCDVDGKLLFR